MASNVLIIEQKSIRDVCERCNELITKYSHGIGLSALCILPLLIIFSFDVVWLIGGSFHEPFYSSGFFLFIIFYYFVSVPISAAVNTFLYFELVEREKIALSKHSTL